MEERTSQHPVELSGRPNGQSQAPAPPYGQPGPPYAPHQLRGAPAWGASTVNRDRRRWIVAVTTGVVAAAAMIAAAIVVVGKQAPSPSAPSPGVSSSAPSAASPTPVSIPQVHESELQGLLLPVQQVADITGAGAMEATGITSGWGEEANNLAEGDKVCAGSFSAAERSVYAASSAQAVRDQVMTAVDKRASVAQAVVAFASADAATEFVAAQVRPWQACAGRSIKYSEPGAPQQDWRFGALQQQDDGDLAITTEWAGSQNPVLCQHVLGARNNIVIDAGVCRPNVDNRGLELLNAIAAKVPS